MNLLLPWSLSTYVPLDGFKFRYRSLASLKSSNTRLLTPRKPGPLEYREITEWGLFRENFVLPAPGWVHPELQDMFYRFAESHGKRELWFQANLTGDAELHHTAPVTLGERPFFLHCESFLPIFSPFFEEGPLDRQKLADVRSLYGRLFESEACLGIASHLKDTIRQLKEFFQSPAIEDRLMHMPIGLDRSCVATVSEKPDPISFLYQGDFGSRPQGSFAARGGIAALELALDLLSERADVVFYFHTRRPTDTALASYGLNMPQLKRHEGLEILWIENPLPTPLQGRLIGRCHFMLLPTSALHSASIMAALANGAVPVVTDTVATDVHVEDRVNGIVIPGGRPALRKLDDLLRPLFDGNSFPPQENRRLAAEMAARIREVMRSPGFVNELSEAGRATARQHFDGCLFAERLVQEIRTRTNSFVAEKSLPAPGVAVGERWVEDISPAHFEGPRQPLERIRLPTGRVVQFGKDFYFLPADQQYKFTSKQSWSPLHMSHQENSPLLSFQLRARSEPNLSDCVAAMRAARDTGLARRLREILTDSASMKRSAVLFLQPYRRIYSCARLGYRLLRRGGVVR